MTVMMMMMMKKKKKKMMMIVLLLLCLFYWPRGRAGIGRRRRKGTGGSLQQRASPAHVRDI